MINRGTHHPARTLRLKTHRHTILTEVVIATNGDQCCPFRIIGETAIAAGKTQTREGARYRRLARRRGKPKALVAVGNTQMKVYHALLSRPGTRYEDLGADHYDQQVIIRRQVRHCVGRLGAPGFEVTLCRIPEPEPGGAGNSQAACPHRTSRP